MVKSNATIKVDRAENWDKAINYIYECKEAHLNILSPSVNTSEYDYKIEEFCLLVLKHQL